MHNLTYCIAKSGWLQHSGEISVSEKKEKRERDKQRMIRGVGSRKKKVHRKTHGSEVSQNQSKAEGYKMTKKQKKNGQVSSSQLIGILTKKPKFWTAVNLSAMGISVFSISFSFIYRYRCLNSREIT